MLSKKVIYSLQQRYGKTIKIQKRITDTVDLTTGNKSVTYYSIPIPKAIVLPTSFEKFMDNQKGAMQYGGLFDTSVRSVIISFQDLGEVVDHTEYWLIIDHQRFNLTQSVKYEDAYILTCKYMPAEPKYEVSSFSLKDILSLSEISVGEL